MNVTKIIEKLSCFISMYYVNNNLTVEKGTDLDDYTLKISDFNTGAYIVFNEKEVSIEQKEDVYNHLVLYIKWKNQRYYHENLKGRTYGI